MKPKLGWFLIFVLTWGVSADVAGVFIRNIVLQKAHAGSVLPAQTVFTLLEEGMLISCRNNTKEEATAVEIRSSPGS